MLLTILFVLLAMAVLKFLKIWNFWKNKGVPYVNVLHSFYNYAENVFRQNSCTGRLEKMYAMYPDARYIGCYQFFEPVLLVRDPELIGKITVKDFVSFTDHNTFIAPEIDQLWTKNLFVMKDEWSKTRASFTPLFTAYKMRIMLKVMDGCAGSLLAYLKTHQKFVDVHDLMTRSATDVFAHTMFGVTCNSHVDRNNEIYTMFHSIAAMNNIKGAAFWGHYFCPILVKFLRVKIFNSTMANFLKSLIFESIRIRKEKSTFFPDLVQMLIEMNAKNVEKNESYTTRKRRLTEDEMVAHALLFCFAGFDTVGYVLTRICKALAEHSNVQDKVYDEIRETSLNFDNHFTYDALYSMTYLHSVILESLRLYSPSALLDRKCVKPYLIEAVTCEEKSLRLEKGAWVWILHCGIQIDPKYYPNPLKFDPDRFNLSNKSDQIPFTFLTFGSGSRKCIAFRFAIMEMKCLLVHLLRSYELLPTEKGSNGHNGQAIFLNFRERQKPSS